MKSALLRNFSTKIVSEMLHLSLEAQQELLKIDQIEFDIFNLRDATNNNELVTVLAYLITSKGILGETALDFEKLLYFTT